MVLLVQYVDVHNENVSNVVAILNCYKYCTFKNIGLTSTLELTFSGVFVPVDV